MTNKIPSKENLEDMLKLFEPESSIPVLTEVPVLPKGGFDYIFEWSPDLLNKKNWRSDGYCWIQGATLSVTSKSGFKCTKYYFKSQIEKGNVSIDSFQRRAIECSKFPRRVLIRYLGDESHAQMFPHGNSKKVTAFTRTKYSELQKLKLEKDKFPVKVYSEKLLEAVEKNLDDRRQNVDVVRDLRQVQNTIHSARVKARSTDDRIYHLIEIANETNFIHDIIITPHQIVTCFSKG